MSNQQKRTFRILLSIAIVLAVALAAVIYAGAALLLGAVGREEAMALPGGERLVRWLRLK